MVEMIVDNLEKGGLERQWCTEVKRKLRDAKRYLKTDYCVHCNPEEAACPDHCRKYALSDEQDPDFQEDASTSIQKLAMTVRICEMFLKK